MRMLGVDLRRLDGDKDLVRTEEDNGAICRQRSPSEAPSIILHEAKVAELLLQPAHRPLAERQGAHPD